MDAADVDAHRFEDRVASAEAEEDLDRRLAHLDVAWWRGAPLGDLAGAAWAERETARLGGLFRRALVRRCETLLDLGGAAEEAAHLGSVEDLPADQPVLTFLMTDIEDSTRLWADYTDTMPAALEQHDALLDEAVERHGGTVLKRTGDGVNAVFTDAAAALRAAVDAQIALAGASWPGTPGLRARMGLHTGPVIAVGRRLLRHGSQHDRPAPRRRPRGSVPGVRGAVRAVADRLPDDIRLLPLGLHRLRGIPGDHRVYQVADAGLPHRFPPPRTLEAAAGVAVPDTSFVGRADELAHLTTLIDRPGTVTLVGPGGVGKTRLAVEVAAEAAHRFRDGVRLIDLAPAAPDAVLAAVAAGLGVVRRGDQSFRDSIIDWLGRKHVLLMVDNCEHVVDVVGPLVRDVGAATSEVTVLSTSRQPLGCVGEVTFPVAPLALPEPGVAAGPDTSPAVRLFVERVEAARPGAPLDAAQFDLVARICRRLDGIPLAVELAAAGRGR